MPYSGDKALLPKPHKKQRHVGRLVVHSDGKEQREKERGHSSRSDHPKQWIEGGVSSNYFSLGEI